MDVVVADAASTDLFAAAVDTPATAVGDLAELLDVHVDQLTRSFAFVTDAGCAGGANDVAGDRVALGQVGHLVAAQDPRHGAGWESELEADPVLSAAFAVT